MKFEEVNYSMTFLLDPHWERIGTRISLEDGDNIMDVIEAAKKFVKEARTKETENVIQQQRLRKYVAVKIPPPKSIMEQYLKAVMDNDIDKMNTITDIYDIKIP